MEEIKEYSSLYATKLAYIANKSPSSYGMGLISYISHTTNEKDTTAKNWLFNKRVPREPKRLAIADSMGISEDYLFNDSIPITAVMKPETVKKEGCYWVPMIQGNEVFYMKHANIFPIVKRIPMMFPQLDELIQEYGNNIYATKMEGSHFEPYIHDDATLLYSENVIIEEYQFVLINLKGLKPKIKRVISIDGDFKLLHYGNRNEEIIESIDPADDLLLILFAFSV